MAKTIARYLLVMIGCLLAGCIGPRPSVMPETEIPFLVLDVESGLPVPGASAYMFYDGPSGERKIRGPFASDEAGRGLISLKSEVLWVSWSDAYFAGGYLRSIAVRASGYEDGGLPEGFDHGAIKKRGSLTFRLRPFRNRYGGAIVTAQRREGDRYILELQIVDGPHGGEVYELRAFNLSLHPVEYAGKKFYLRQSIESMEAEKVRYGMSAFNFDIVLRPGFPDEPFVPPAN